MKVTGYFVIAITMALASCSNEELVSLQNVSQLQTSMEVERVSRVGFNKENNWAFYWHNGDEIWVNGKIMRTTDPDKSTTANFGGYNVNTEQGYAVYPYDLAKDKVLDADFTLTLPESYHYDAFDASFFASSQIVPMSAKVEDGKAIFKHLGAVAAIKFNDWEPTGEHVFTLATSKKITGDFIVNLSSDVPEYKANVNEPDDVQVSFTRALNAGAGTFVIYVPLPTGTYDIKLSMKSDGDIWYEEEFKNRSINRADIVWYEVGKSTLEGSGN